MEIVASAYQQDATCGLLGGKPCGAHYRDTRRAVLQRCAAGVQRPGEFYRTRTKKPSIQPKVNKAGNLKAEDINKGDKVKHERFGVGTVLAVEPVAGDAILSIDFEEVGEKKILANSANLARA